MNTVMSQDIKLTHRNPLHSCTVTRIKQKEKLRKQYHSPLQQTKDLYIENYKSLMKEIRGHKQMEKYTVFMDWKNQYCQNGYTTQSNL